MLEPHEALCSWQLDGPAASPRPAPDAGLINRTYLVGDPPQAVLQWVNPIFDASIHHDIAALTQRLDEVGLGTPRLLPTRDGALSLGDTEGCWRLLSYVPGRTVHRLEGPELAYEAGRLVGRFHAAVADWDHRFVAPRRDIHDTQSRMAELEAALDQAEGHPLADEVRPVGDAILEAWRSWNGSLDQPDRPCHGDLKISNLRFGDDGRGVCLIDLDTIGPMSIDAEMGDAWRSWCNPVPEDRPEEARFALDRFRASARGWLSTAPALAASEGEALVPAIERIALELAARFATDAVQNGYFWEDRERFPQPGWHNLLRAHGQLTFARSAREQRAEAERGLR